MAANLACASCASLALSSLLCTDAIWLRYCLWWPILAAISLASDLISLERPAIWLFISRCILSSSMSPCLSALDILLDEGCAESSSSLLMMSSMRRTFSLANAWSWLESMLLTSDAPVRSIMSEMLANALWEPSLAICWSFSIMRPAMVDSSDCPSGLPMP